MTYQGSDSHSLSLSAGWVQDTEGQASPPDAGLPHLGKSEVIPVGIGVPAGPRSDPQLPSYSAAVAREVSHPNPWAFTAAAVNSGWDCKPGPSRYVEMYRNTEGNHSGRLLVVTFQQSIPTEKAIKCLIFWLLLKSLWLHASNRTLACAWG